MRSVSAEEIVRINKSILRKYPMKRGDKHEVLNRAAILRAVNSAEQATGDIYTKAAKLLCDIVQAHPFASGNKRTAFFSAREFLEINDAPFLPPDTPENARVLIAIREGFYSLEDIKEWLEHGKEKEIRRG